MGLIYDLLGKGKPKFRTIAEVESSLARLAAERTAARESIAVAGRKRDELLLVDGSDAKIAALEVETDRTRLTLERCEKAEGLLLEELQALRAEAKRALWLDFRNKYDEGARSYADALRGALQRQDVMLGLNDEARRHGFEREVMAAFIPPARVVSAEALAEFQAAIERASELARPTPAPRPVTPAKAPQTASPAAPQRPSAPKAAAPPKPVKPPFVPPPADADGNVQITILRPGLEIEGRERPRAGETVRLPADQAAAIVRAGNGDYAGAMQ